MKIFDVRFCVADALPNGNDALAFANHPDHKGRVFLADYSYEAQKGEDIAIWGDKVKKDPNRKAADETKSKYRVRVSRYHAIEWNLMRYVNRIKRQPHEKGLIGEVTDRRRKRVKSFICEEVFWAHLMAVARRKHVLDETQDKFKMVFENIGFDPHFLHADLYCELALTRINEGGGLFHTFKAQEDASNGKLTSHEFAQFGEDPSHYRCEQCGIAVAVPSDMTADEFAYKAGHTQCK